MSGPAALMRETRLTVSDLYAWDASGGTIATAAAAAKRVAFTEFSPNAAPEKMDMGEEFGGMGSLDHFADNFRDNRILVAPSLAGLWTVDEWYYMLPWVMNGTPSGSGPYTFPLGVPGTRRNLIFDSTVDVWNLVGCQVSRFTLSAQASGPVAGRVECQGITFDKTTSFPASPTALTFTKRFLMGDQALTATGFTGTLQPRSVSLEIDHGTNNDRFYGSFTSGGPVNTNRKITLALSLPYKLHTALWELGAAAGGVPMSLAFTAAGASSNLSLTFTMPAVVAQKPPPEVADPELFASWKGDVVVASGGAANSSLVAVLDKSD
jgi:hypothetical protein